MKLCISYISRLRDYDNEYFEKISVDTFLDDFESLLGLRVSRFNSKIMSCAPRDQWNEKYQTYKSEMGSCYYLKNDSQMRKKFDFKSSKTTIDRQSWNYKELTKL